MKFKTPIKKIFQQTFWQILGKVITTLSAFIILGLIARNYGAEGIGVFTLALTYLAIFYLLSDFGFNAHVLKKFKTPSSNPIQSDSNVKAEWQQLLGTRLIWSAVLVILAVGLLPFWPFTTADFAKTTLFGALAIIFSAVFVTCNLIFQSRLRYDLSVLASAGGSLVGLLVTVWLISLGYPIPILILGHLIGWIVIALAALILVRSSSLLRVEWKFVFNLPYAIDLFRHSWPIAATLAVNVVYFRADSFMIAYFKTVADAGVYNVAYSVFQSVLVLPTFIMNSYYPLMLKSQAAVSLVGVGLFGLSLLATLITFTFAPFIISILTGGGFVGSVESLQILALGFPAYFLSALLMWFLIAKGQYKKVFLLYTLITIFNLILNFIYIPKYSFLAAAWITVVSEYAILLLQAVVLLNRRQQR